ncbi:MAG: zeta toxin family protein [Steroidobacteraceae bacterium]
MPASIFVLAGVNGAGKSSIGGAALAARGAGHFDPDVAARIILAANPGLAIEHANGLAWDMGRRGLQRALREHANFAFETTLGARTLTDLLLEGARDGARVHVWFAGLASPELHLQRVRARVLAGGHDIPAAKIRERYDSSRANLLRLLPHLASLRVYDNSTEADPKAGLRPEPRLLLVMQGGRVVDHAPLVHIPDWSKPILAAALASGSRSG